MQDLAVTNKQVTDEINQNNEKFNKKLTRNDSDLENINTLLIQVLSQKRTNLTYNMDLEKSHDPTIVVPYNNRDSPLEGGHYTIIGGMRDLKHEIISSKFYEILTKKELKCETALDLKNFYNHINMYINEVNRLREDLLTD